MMDNQMVPSQMIPKKIKLEGDRYQEIKDWLQELLERRFASCHLEVTADRKFSNVLKAQIDQSRDIIFHFLKETVPDITGFISSSRGREFIVVEVKAEAIRLEDIYQLKRYAELFNASYSLLVSASEIPEEIKRLCRIAPHILSALAGYRQIALVSLQLQNGNLSAEWFPNGPFWEKYESKSDN